MGKQVRTAGDITITGSGFYQITGQTHRGRKFLLRVQGEENGTAYCDDTRLTEEIADGAFAKGLRVLVNGRRYIGAGQVAV